VEAERGVDVESSEIDPPPGAIRRKRGVVLAVGLGLAIVAVSGFAVLRTRSPTRTNQALTASDSPRPTPTASPWTKFVAPDGSFSVIGPGTFAVATEPAQEGQGIPEEQHLLFHPSGGDRFDVYWYDADPSSIVGLTPAQWLGQTSHDFVSSTSGTAERIRDTRVDDYPCLDFDDHISGGTFRVRMCLAGRRFYQVTVSEASQFISIAGTADRFISSFHILHG